MGCGGVEQFRSPPGARESDYLPTLDGWRGLAILLVLFYHGSDSIRQACGPWVPSHAKLPFNPGEIGLEIFFGLSGFLIATRLVRERAAQGAIDLRKFYVKRVHRIVPPLIVFLSVAGVLGLCGVITIRLKYWLSALLLYANYSNGATWPLGHFWTLSMEEHFYLTWPVMLYFSKDRRAALLLTLGLIAGVVVWRTMDLRYEMVVHRFPAFWQRTDTRCDGLLWGCVFAFAYTARGERKQLRRWFNPWTFALLASAFICLMSRLEFPGKQWAVMLGVNAALVPMLLLTTLLHPQSWMGSVLEWRALRWVGRLSYSLYLWQQLFLVWSGLGSPYLTWVQWWPLNLLCSFVFAAGSYYLIEKPMIREGYRVAASESRVKDIEVAILS